VKKICTRCKQSKDLDEFDAQRDRKDGKNSQCKTCRSIHFQGVKHSARYRLKTYKNGARRRNIRFELSLKEFDEITKRFCVYCGGFSDSEIENFCGIDRLDSSLGYVEGNVVPCCWMCNDMKGTLTSKEFINHIKKIHCHSRLFE